MSASRKKVIVFRFQTYDGQNDTMITSRRWATRDAIKWVRGHVLEDTAVEVDASTIGKDIPGMSEINFDPHRSVGFQSQAKI